MEQGLLDKIKTNLNIFADNLSNGGIFPEVKKESRSESENHFYRSVISFYSIILIFIILRYFFPVFYNNFVCKKGKSLNEIGSYLLGAASKNDPNHDVSEKVWALIIPLSYLYYNFVVITKASFLLDYEENSCRNSTDLLKLLAGNILFSIFMIFYSYIPFNDQIDDGVESMLYFWFAICLLNILFNSCLLLAFGFVYEKEYCDLFFPQ